MKKYIFLAFLLFPNFSYAETAVKDPIADLKGIYQNTETDGTFWRTSTSWVQVYNKTWDQIYSATPWVATCWSPARSHTIVLPWGKHLSFVHWCPDFNWQLANHVNITDLTNGTNIYDAILQAWNVWVSWNAGCQWYMRVRVALNGNKIIYQMQASSSNSWFSCPDRNGNYYEVDIFNPQAPQIFTWDLPNNFLTLYNNVDLWYLQVYTNDALLYKKTNDIDTIYKFECNEFQVCSESSFLDIQIANNGEILAFQHIIPVENGDVKFSGINMQVWDSNSWNLQFWEYTLDENNLITWIEFTPNRWYTYAKPNGNFIRTIFLDPVENVSEGLLYDVRYTPLVISEYDTLTEDKDFYYKRGTTLYNFWGNYQGVLIENRSAWGVWGGQDPSPPPEDWTFSTSGYSFFENWFALHNFIPDPYGGQISFDIISPWETQPERTESFWSYETDGNGYWFDSTVKITFPYHDKAWDYQVRVVYEYNGISVFPFWETYDNYTISLPEVAWANPDDLAEWEYSSCNSWSESSWFLPWVSNFFTCLWESIGNMFNSIKNFFWRIRDFFNSFWWIVTDEVNTFSLIPWVYASQTSIGTMPVAWEEFYATPIGKITRVLQGILVVFFLVVWIASFIFINRNK